MAKIKTASRLTNETPETIQQARTWETVASAYQGEGLCRGCAGQAAYGHQLGFLRVKSPCVDCQPIVDGFPLSGGKLTGWRKFSDGRYHSK